MDHGIGARFHFISLIFVGEGENKVPCVASELDIGVKNETKRC